MKTTEAAGVRIGLYEDEVLIALEDRHGAAVQQLLFDPAGAESLAVDLNKFAAMARAKKQGAAGSA